MQSKHLWVVNFILASLGVWLGWRLASDWRSGNERYKRLTAISTGEARAYAPPVARPVAANLGAGVVARNPFSPDRNSMVTVAVETAAPVLPVIFGTMRLGNDYEALASEGGAQASRTFRRVKAGERVGGYTIAEIHDDRVVVEYQGQKSTIDVYQSAKSVAPPADATPARAAPAAVETVAAPAAPAASPPPAATPAAPGNRTPLPGVRMTIEGNRRRYERDTPFGPQVWYEEIPQ